MNKQIACLLAASFLTAFTAVEDARAENLADRWAARRFGDHLYQGNGGGTAVECPTGIQIVVEYERTVFSVAAPQATQDGRVATLWTTDA